MTQVLFRVFWTRHNAIAKNLMDLLIRENFFEDAANMLVAQTRNYVGYKAPLPLVDQQKVGAQSGILELPVNIFGDRFNAPFIYTMIEDDKGVHLSFSQIPGNENSLDPITNRSALVSHFVSERLGSSAIGKNLDVSFHIPKEGTREESFYTANLGEVAEDRFGERPRRYADSEIDYGVPQQKIPAYIQDAVHRHGPSEDALLRKVSNARGMELDTVMRQIASHAERGYYIIARRTEIDLRPQVRVSSDMQNVPKA